MSTTTIDNTVSKKMGDQARTTDKANTVASMFDVVEGADNQLFLTVRTGRFGIISSRIPISSDGCIVLPSGAVPIFRKSIAIDGEIVTVDGKMTRTIKTTYLTSVKAYMMRTIGDAKLKTYIRRIMERDGVAEIEILLRGLILRCLNDFYKPTCEWDAPGTDFESFAQRKTFVLMDGTMPTLPGEFGADAKTMRRLKFFDALVGLGHTRYGATQPGDPGTTADRCDKFGYPVHLRIQPLAHLCSVKRYSVQRGISHLLPITGKQDPLVHVAEAGILQPATANMHVVCMDLRLNDAVVLSESAAKRLTSYIDDIDTHDIHSLITCRGGITFKGRNGAPVQKTELRKLNRCFLDNVDLDKMADAAELNAVAALAQSEVERKWRIIGRRANNIVGGNYGRTFKALCKEHELDLQWPSDFTLYGHLALEAAKTEYDSMRFSLPETKAILSSRPKPEKKETTEPINVVPKLDYMSVLRMLRERWTNQFGSGNVNYAKAHKRFLRSGGTQVQWDNATSNDELIWGSDCCPKQMAHWTLWREQQILWIESRKLWSHTNRPVKTRYESADIDRLVTIGLSGPVVLYKEYMGIRYHKHQDGMKVQSEADLFKGVATILDDSNMPFIEYADGTKVRADVVCDMSASTLKHGSLQFAHLTMVLNAVAKYNGTGITVSHETPPSVEDVVKMGIDSGLYADDDLKVKVYDRTGKKLLVCSGVLDGMYPAGIIRVGRHRQDPDINGGVVGDLPLNKMNLRNTLKSTGVRTGFIDTMIQISCGFPLAAAEIRELTPEAELELESLRGMIHFSDNFVPISDRAVSTGSEFYEEGASMPASIIGDLSDKGINDPCKTPGAASGSSEYKGIHNEWNGCKGYVRSDGRVVKPYIRRTRQVVAATVPNDTSQG